MSVLFSSMVCWKKHEKYNESPSTVPDLYLCAGCAPPADQLFEQRVIKSDCLPLQVARHTNEEHSPKKDHEQGQTGSKDFPAAMQKAVFEYLLAAFPLLTARVQTVQLRCVHSRLLSKRKLKLSKQLPNKPSRQRSKRLRSRLRSKAAQQAAAQQAAQAAQAAQAVALPPPSRPSRLHKQHRQRNKLQV